MKYIIKIKLKKRQDTDHGWATFVDGNLGTSGNLVFIYTKRF